jgi:hypothetical protein
VRGEGAAAALWVDPAVHADECRRFDSYVVKGPGPDDCDFFTGAIGTDGCGQSSTSTEGAAGSACDRTATPWRVRWRPRWGLTSSVCTATTRCASRRVGLRRCVSTWWLVRSSTRAMFEWGRRHLPGRNRLRLTHLGCGADAEIQMRCTEGHLVPLDELGMRLLRPV